MSTLEVKAIQAPSGFDLDMPAGHIVQVVNGVTSTSTSITSTSFVDTTLTVNITPKFATSKLLVIAEGSCQVYDNGYVAMAFAQILRGSTALKSIRYGAYVAAGSDTNWYGTHTITYLDSPSTTSQLTYKVQAKLTGGGHTTIWQPDSMPSTITVMEVAQ